MVARRHAGVLRELVRVGQHLVWVYLHPGIPDRLPKQPSIFSVLGECSWEAPSENGTVACSQLCAESRCAEVSLTHKIRGEWTSAFSSLLGFCTKSAEREADVSHFRPLLQRFHCKSSVGSG